MSTYVSPFVLSREMIEHLSKMTREQVLDAVLPDVDVTKVAGAIVTLDNTREEIPDCGHYGCCSLFLSHQCDGIRQGFCEDFE